MSWGLYTLKIEQDRVPFPRCWFRETLDLKLLKQNWQFNSSCLIGFSLSRIFLSSFFFKSSAWSSSSSPSITTGWDVFDWFLLPEEVFENEDASIKSSSLYFWRWIVNFEGFINSVWQIGQIFSCSRDTLASSSSVNEDKWLFFMWFRSPYFESSIILQTTHFCFWHVMSLEILTFTSILLSNRFAASWLVRFNLFDWIHVFVVSNVDGLIAIPWDPIVIWGSFEVNWLVSFRFRGGIGFRFTSTGKGMNFKYLYTESDLNRRTCHVTRIYPNPNFN